MNMIKFVLKLPRKLSAEIAIPVKQLYHVFYTGCLRDTAPFTHQGRLKVTSFEGSIFVYRDGCEKEVESNPWVHSQRFILGVEKICILKDKEVRTEFERLVNENPVSILWMKSTSVSNNSRGEDTKSTNCMLRAYIEKVLATADFE